MKSDFLKILYIYVRFLIKRGIKMDSIEELNFVDSLVYEAEHCDATVEEAYDAVCKLLDDFLAA